ncbi:MAG: hypothetical protein ACE5LU_07250 [Anaerolineae bacterium]
MAEPSLYDVVKELFQKIGESPQGREALKMYDHTLIFSALDGETLHVAVKGGQAQVKPGLPPSRPITEAHEFKADEAVFRDFFAGRRRFSDAVYEGDLFPMAAHTAKRHIDHWLVKLVNIGNGIPSLKELY